MIKTKKFLELMATRLWPSKVARISDIDLWTVNKILNGTHTTMKHWTLRRLVSNRDKWYSEWWDALVDMQDEVSLFIKKKKWE